MNSGESEFEDGFSSMYRQTFGGQYAVVRREPHGMVVFRVSMIE